MALAPITSMQAARILSLYDVGTEIDEIASEIGRPRHSIVSFLRHLRPDGRRPDEVDEAGPLRADDRVVREKMCWIRFQDVPPTVLAGETMRTKGLARHIVSWQSLAPFHRRWCMIAIDRAISSV